MFTGNRFAGLPHGPREAQSSRQPARMPAAALGLAAAFTSYSASEGARPVLLEGEKSEQAFLDRGASQPGHLLESRLR